VQFNGQFLRGHLYNLYCLIACRLSVENIDCFTRIIGTMSFKHFDISIVIWMIWHTNFMCKFAKILQFLWDEVPYRPPDRRPYVNPIYRCATVVTNNEELSTRQPTRCLFTLQSGIIKKFKLYSKR
jgi:hypothetical protein